jgi:di/tricarboxylate transporter
MIFVLVLLGLAVALFVTERIRTDLVALSILALLAATGIVGAEEALAGFSNPATVTVAAMFVLSASLGHTRALDRAAGLLAQLAERNLMLALVALMVVVGSISAFINNTAAVAVFLPIALAMARHAAVSPSKLLIPLSFAGIFGGTCTLIGTSTNVLASSISETRGAGPIGMFEPAPLGLVLFAAGAVWIATMGHRLLPARRAAGDLASSFQMADYIVEVKLPEGSESVGVPLGESPLLRDMDIDVLELFRAGKRRSLPRGETELRAGDVLRLRCDAETVRQLNRAEGSDDIRLLPHLRDEDLETDDAVLAEAVVAPHSSLIGRSVADAGILDTYGAALLALRHRGSIQHARLAGTRLRAGDLVLLELPRRKLRRMQRDRRELLLVSTRDVEPRRRRTWPALLVIAAVVAVAAVDVLPIATAAVIGCVAVVLLGCVSLDEAYEAIDWQIVFLLAGLLSLGAAMEETGAAQRLASLIVEWVGPLGPRALVSAFFLLTAALTSVMSNNATAVLLAPIALSTADSLGLESRPFLMAVAFGASACFLTPVGYQTNMLVHGPGQYRAGDFLRVGGPLVLIYWLLASLLIPWFWPLAG